MIVVYDRSFIVLARVITIVNYDPKSFIVQATDLEIFTLPRARPIKFFTAVINYVLWAQSDQMIWKKCPFF